MNKMNPLLLSFAVPLVAFGAYGASQDPKPASAPRGFDEILAGWPEASRTAAEAMAEKYGSPDGVTPILLIWQDTAPFAQTIVYRDPVQHNFPKPHEDVLEQFVGYRVPADKFDEIASYDGSVVCERTNGLMSARCDKEPMNYLALNLAHDLIEGKRTVEEARRHYGEVVKRFMEGDEDPYTQKLNFQSKRNAGDPDKPLSSGR